MKENHENYIKNIIEQSEEIKDNVDIINQLDVKIKRVKKIFLVVFCAFLAIILYSCSVRYNKSTIVSSSGKSKVVNSEIPNGVLPPINEIESTEETESPEETEPTEESDTNEHYFQVARIDIGVNEGVTFEDNNLYLMATEQIPFDAKTYDNAEDYQCLGKIPNNYFVKSISVDGHVVHEPEKHILDKEDGINASTFTNLGVLSLARMHSITNENVEINELFWRKCPNMFEALGCEKTIESYPEQEASLLHYKETDTQTGVSLVVYINRKVSEDDLKQIAEEIITYLDSLNMTYNKQLRGRTIGEDIVNLTGAKSYVITAEGTGTYQYDKDSVNVDTNETIDRTALILNIDTFYFDSCCDFYEGDVGMILEDLNSKGYHH